jgi:hypothetical protein
MYWIYSLIEGWAANKDLDTNLCTDSSLELEFVLDSR